MLAPGTFGRYEMSGTLSVLDDVPASSETLYATSITVTRNAVLRLSLTDFN